MLNYSNAYTRYIWFHGAIFCLVLLLMPARQIIAAERELTLSTFPGSIHQAVGAPILKEAYAKLGMSLKLYMVPAKRALAASSAGATDGEVNRIGKVATRFPTLRQVGGPVLPLQGRAFVFGKSPSIKSWEDLRPYRIGVVRGVPFSDKPTQGMDRILAKDPAHLFKLLVHDRIDIAITTSLNGRYTIGKHYPKKNIRALGPPVLTIDTYHYLHEKHRGLIPRVAKVLAEMKESGRIDAIIDTVISDLIAGRTSLPAKE